MTLDELEFSSLQHEKIINAHPFNPSLNTGIWTVMCGSSTPLNLEEFGATALCQREFPKLSPIGAKIWKTLEIGRRAE